jgi:hypothetical protein
MTSQVLPTRRSPELKDRGYDSVLPDQGYNIAQGAVLERYGTVAE